MKIKGTTGEFGFKALVKEIVPSSRPQQVWHLTEWFVFSKEEAQKYLGSSYEVIWPVEVMDNGSVYIPDQSEFE